MELKGKLRICVVLSVLALILKIIIFASPGWAIIRRHVTVEPKDMIMPENDGIHVDELPEEMGPMKERVSISFGLWYYKVCMCGAEDKDDDDDEDSGENSSEDKRHHRHHHKRHHHKCYHKCYRHKKHHNKEENNGDMVMPHEEHELDIPEEFKPAKNFITEAVVMARHSRHELAAYVTIGLILGIIGTIAAIKYARGGGLGKHAGRLACSTQVLSSFFLWMAIIRVGTYIVQLSLARDHGFIIDKETKFAVPWCLVVGAIAALLMDLAALFHMILISRDRRSDGIKYECKVETGKAPILAPLGFNQLVFPYLQMNEEAGPLPEKEALS